MSNQNVGTVYQQIIGDVIDASRVDFEEGGVDERILEELKKGWQRKLSQLGVAVFPWDPKPEPPPQPAAAAPAAAVAAPAAQQPPSALLDAQAPTHSNVTYTQAQLSPQVNAQSLSLPGAPAPQQNGSAPVIKQEPGLANAEPAIKQEPGLANSGMANQFQSMGNQVAQQRAAQALANQYGQRAQASINAIQQGGQGQVPLPQQAQRPGQQPVPTNMPPQYRNAVPPQQRAPPAPQPNGIPVQKAQTDGAADNYEGVLIDRDANGNAVELGRVDIDRMLHETIASRAKEMEGGGLMVPLREATKHKSTKKNKRRAAAGPSAGGQFDGLDDDIKDEEDFDEDAINSDLDDPEDDQDDEDDDDESMGHIMLCMYDKVQRVKNKWKCNMKDGVLTVNGKEYVFHKATGEYEW